jgi:hypothetical protein
LANGQINFLATKKTFNDFALDSGRIKLRVHHEAENFRDLPKETLEIYIYDGLYNDGRFETVKIKNGVFDFLNRSYSASQNNSNITQVFALEETGRKQCDMNVFMDLGNLINSTDLKEDIVWNVEGEITIKINSTNCALNLMASVNLEIEKHENKAIYYSMLITMLAVFMLYSVAKMIKNSVESSNEANKISMVMIGILTSWDAFICLTHLYLALSIESMFHFFIMPTFWYFILFSIFELKLLILIWRARYYDRYQTNEQIRRGLVIFYVKLYAAMFTIIFLLYRFILSNAFIVVMSLYLVPQIVHNAMRGQRAEFNGKFLCLIVGTRIMLPLYYRGCPDNILEISPAPWFCVTLLLVTGAQILIIYYQSVYGSRFFVPEKFLPPRFNYLMTIPDVDLEAGYFESIDDCVVCLRPLHQDAVLGADSTGQSQYLLSVLNAGKNQVMRTPCDHKFHVKCLVNWMSYKMDCPTCRARLPPIE